MTNALTFRAIYKCIGTDTLSPSGSLRMQTNSQNQINTKAFKFLRNIKKTKILNLNLE